MKSASIFRVEGPIFGRPPVSEAAWFALNQDSLDKRLTRLGGVLAAKLTAAIHPLGGGPTSDRLAWSNLRGMSVDRLMMLAAEYRETQLAPRLRPAGLRLVEDARRRGQTLVFVSSVPALIMEPLLVQMGADHVICSALEIRDDEVTGRLEEPSAARLDGAWARAFAARHDVDLAASEAYGAEAHDALWMSQVGRPTAVHPDWRLRRIAEEHGWPVVEG
jgi:phosphoserine phosphatase